MATLSVLKFNDLNGADRVLLALQGLEGTKIANKIIELAEGSRLSAAARDWWTAALAPHLVSDAEECP
jgi:hypothetical protein